MVSDVTVTGSVLDAKKTQQSGLKLAEDFTQFLTLLTTQLQNQDPLSPMENAEFMGQMASFSTLEQVSKLASANEQLAAQMSLCCGSTAGAPPALSS